MTIFHSLGPMTASPPPHESCWSRGAVFAEIYRCLIAEMAFHEGERHDLSASYGHLRGWPLLPPKPFLSTYLHSLGSPGQGGRSNPVGNKRD